MVEFNGAVFDFIPASGISLHTSSFDLNIRVVLHKTRPRLRTLGLSKDALHQTIIETVMRSPAGRPSDERHGEFFRRP